MVQVVRIHKTGGPEVMNVEQMDLPPPRNGEVVVRHHVVGLNYIDTYHRSGLYPLPLPAVLGMEAAGVVEQVGAGVTTVKVGDRVAYADPRGAYCEARIMPASRLVRLPDDIPDEIAASIMLKGMTAQYLCRRTVPVKKGDVVLLHAAAGGVGTLLSQWLNHLGATVIGTVGSEEKARLAKQHGCHHTILYRQEDFVQRVRELTTGAGVDVVYDSVGKDTFLKSLECLRPLGRMVSFGQSSGAIAPFDVGVLAQRGSLFLTRPTLMTYVASEVDLRNTAVELFDVVRNGVVKVSVGQRYRLEDVVQAHRELEARVTHGASVMLVPRA